MQDYSSTNLLSNQFLIAMPHLASTHFSHSVTYLCEHNEEGSMGIVINHPLKLSLAELFRHLNISKIDNSMEEYPVFLGGPVQSNRGFVLHDGGNHWRTSIPITDSIFLTASHDILEDIACKQGPMHFLVALGYAGWSSGQLASEIQANAWLSIEADAQHIFITEVEQRWYAAAAQLGIVDMNLISSQIGHA